jgi:hypothetical protein
MEPSLALFWISWTLYPEFSGGVFRSPEAFFAAKVHVPIQPAGRLYCGLRCAIPRASIPPYPA